MAIADEREQDLRIELMAADIENKRADTDYKRTMMRWEPWKAMAVAAGAGATFTLALLALATGLAKLWLAH
jgi:hypothetical protein